MVIDIDDDDFEKPISHARIYHKIADWLLAP